MMFQSIKIMLPIVPKPLKDTIYFRGSFNKKDQSEIVIYITEFSTNKNILESTFDNFCGCFESPAGTKINIVDMNNYLILDQMQSTKIKKLVIAGKEVTATKSCIVILYDHKTVKHSEALFDSDDLCKLHILLSEKTLLKNKDYEPAIQIPFWLSSSMLAQHILNYLNLIFWLVHTIKFNKKISIKAGNIILAIALDIIIGYYVLELLTQDKKILSSTLMGILEKLVNLLYLLLKWLMGSPAGLKLNNAFNKMLGNYFSYHIQLWWLFLDVSGEKLDLVLHFYHYIGYLGFTFQAAMISDMICIATFHSYCIYVYAARLFNIQVSGLIALLRLFVGRKYNPLRGGIDSCEYTNQELFVGTVAFTILLLLMPTTAMYYIVFTLFRLLSLLVQYSLAKVIHMIQTLPLYVVALWLARSPKVAGNIFMEVINNKECSPLVLRVKLYNLSLKTLINRFRTPVEAPKHFEWTNVLSNIIVGKQLT